jgi:5'-nucleotidase
MKLYVMITGVLLAVSLLLVACGGSDAPSSVATVTPPPTLTPVPSPTSRPTPTAAPIDTPTPTGSYQLTILHNNDGESQLLDLGSELKDFGGIARFATVVQRERQRANSESDGVILVSSGDNSLAGPEFTAGLRNGTYYDALALDLIGYDAIALGNHDFDFGPEVLANFIMRVSDSEAPFLSSNLDFSGEPDLQVLFDEGRIAESVVVRKNGERIGIIGATTPNLRFISSPRNVQIISDVAGEVQAEVDELEADGVNRIILISHLQDIEAEIALLKQIDGVDVVVAGGGDELLANPNDLLVPGDEPPFGPYPIIAKDMDGTEVPVVTTSGQYGYLGKLVVTFDGDGNLIDIDEEASGPIRIAGGDNPDAVRPDPQVQQLVLDPVVRFIDDLRRPIGISQVDLEGHRSEVRSRETNQGNLMADALRWQAGRMAADYGVSSPDVAIQNGGGIRNDAVLPAGAMGELDTFDMAPFSNLLTVLENISREQFKEVLENAVSRAVEGDTSGGSGRFAQVSGFSFEWSESGAAQILGDDGTRDVPGTRVQSVVLDDGTVIVDGGTVVPGPALTVATIDFLARGGDQYPYRGAPFTILGVSYQQALANYIQDSAGLNGTVTSADYPEGGEGRIVRLP